MATKFTSKADVAKSAVMLTGLAATSIYTAIVFATFAAACWQSLILGSRYQKQVDAGRLLLKGKM